MSTDWRALCAELLKAVDDCDDYTLTQGATVARARAVLARYAHQPAPPVEGEVGELVAWLHGQDGGIGRRAIYSRIADLLSQRHPAPVLVAERLPDASDPGECRMPDGDCWWFDPHADGAWYMDTYQSCYTHWLPATALPLPAGEVQP